MLLLIGIISCGEDPLMPDEEIVVQVPTIIPDGSERYLSDDSEYIFDQDQVHTFALEVPTNLLNKLDSDPAAEEYVDAMLIFQGDTISPVGLRYKGSIGGWVGCLSSGDIFNPSGFKTCPKLSMKVKINWDGREERFFKLNKLQFHSQNLDPSRMRERLGYWLFQEMGVPSPRSVHAKVVINGEFAGLFALTEQIDGRFAKYNFEDGDGNLYKEIWPLRMNGNPFSDNQYRQALKTNEDVNTSVDLIKSFAQEVADANMEESRNIVEQYMDIDEIISYAVVDRTIRHDDGPFHWYCFGGDCESHNFYWYEEPNNQKLHLIPWDLDNAFENIISNSNPITPIFDKWGETSNNCKVFTYPTALQWSASCDKLTGTWASYIEEYNKKKLTLIEGPMSESVANQKLELWQSQIREAVMQDKDMDGNPASISSWESAVDQLKKQLNFARNN